MINTNPILFAGSSGTHLSDAIMVIPHMGIQIGSIYHHTFPSGEKYSQIKENIRGRDVFLIQSTGYPANDNLMQLMVMIDAARRASAERITVIIPSIVCYSRQDRKDKSRTPISAKLIANLLTCAGANRILGMDFHSPQFAGFFDIPVDQLYAAPLFLNYLKNNKIENLVVVSPDEGAIKRSSAFAHILKSEFAFHSKKRIGDTDVISQGLIGNVNGKNVIIYDDMIESAGTLLEVSKICKQQGAISVTGMITHNCLTQIGYERLKADVHMDKLIVTNTLLPIIPPLDKIEIISVGEIFAKAIRHIHNSESITELFDIKGF